MKPIVIVESPYAGNVAQNVEYAREAVRDCILRGEVPLASHLLYTQRGILDDAVPEERQLGIDLGHAVMALANYVVVYTDLGVSRGMEAGLAVAREIGLAIEARSIPGWAP